MKLTDDRLKHFFLLGTRAGQEGKNYAVTLHNEDVAAMAKELLPAREVVEAAAHLIKPSTQILQVTALCAWDDLKKALAKYDRVIGGGDD